MLLKLWPSRTRLHQATVWQWPFYSAGSPLGAIGSVSTAANSKCNKRLVPFWVIFLHSEVFYALTRCDNHRGRWECGGSNRCQAESSRPCFIFPVGLAPAGRSNSQVKGKTSLDVWHLVPCSQKASVCPAKAAPAEDLPAGLMK